MTSRTWELQMLNSAASISGSTTTEGGMSSICSSVGETVEARREVSVGGCVGSHSPPPPVVKDSRSANSARYQSCCC